MGINPTAIVFWAFLALLTYLTMGTALPGLCVGLGISLLVSMVCK